MPRACFENIVYRPPCLCKSVPGAAFARRFLGAATRTLAVVLCCLPPLTGYARDVSREQNAVQYARDELQKADAEYQAAMAQVARTRKEIEPLQQRLARERKQASLSQRKRQQARVRLNEAQAALERAWKE